MKGSKVVEDDISSLSSSVYDFNEKDGIDGEYDEDRYNREVTWLMINGLSSWAEDQSILQKDYKKNKELKNYLDQKIVKNECTGIEEWRHKLRIKPGSLVDQ